MKRFISAILMLGALMTAVAQDDGIRDITRARASYQEQVVFAKKAYLQKLESLSKTTSFTKNQLDAIQAEISKLKGESVESQEALLPNTAPEKPRSATAGIKTLKISEFPRDLTATDWEDLPGKELKVNIAEESNFGKDVIVIKDGESFYAVPHPTDRWSLNKKVSCTWEGIPLDDAPGCRAGKLMIWASRTEGKNNSWNSFNFNTPIVGPLKICLNTPAFDQFPRIYYKGEIRVKLVPSE